jgi:hypothetical protein
LRVLLDVFIRELVDLPDEAETVSFVVHSKMVEADVVVTTHLPSRSVSTSQSYAIEE